MAEWQRNRIGYLGHANDPSGNDNLSNDVEENERSTPMEPINIPSGHDHICFWPVASSSRHPNLLLAFRCARCPSSKGT